MFALIVAAGGGGVLYMCDDQDFMEYDESADGRRLHPGGRPNLKRDKVYVNQQGFGHQSNRQHVYIL